MATGTTGHTPVVVRRVRDYWNWRADSFAADIAATPDRAAWSDLYASAVGRLLPDRRPLRILDVGTGTGFVAILLAELGHEVTAVDPAPAMLELAGKEAAERGVAVVWREGTATALGLGVDGDSGAPAAGFDLVTCRNLLWTLPDPVGALRHWATVLRPGGAVLVSDAMWNTWRREWALLRGGVRSVTGVEWRFFRSYLRLRRHLPYYRGLDARRAHALLDRADYPCSLDLGDLLTGDLYGRDGDKVCLVGAYTASRGK